MQDFLAYVKQLGGMAILFSIIFVLLRLMIHYGVQIFADYKGWSPDRTVETRALLLRFAPWVAVAYLGWALLTS